MKIQYMSDLHMELQDNSRYIKELEIPVTGDVLVLAGDTAYLRDTTMPNKNFWKWASKNYRQVLLVSGNHEYYGQGDVLSNGECWQSMILPNERHDYLFAGFDREVQTDKIKLFVFDTLKDDEGNYCHEQLLKYKEEVMIIER